MRINFKNYRFKIAFAILLVMGLLFTQIVLAGWQSDNGNGTFKNPILYADYPDPSMIRVGNDFYLASSTFVNSPGLVILHSQDLVNWEIISHCISSLPSGGAYDMNGGTKYGNGCFAPGLAYNNGTFYVAVNLNGDGGTRIYRATNPAGPWSMSQLSSAYFDPCLFFDNGTPYLVWGGAWENSIKMIQLNSSLSGTTGSQKTIISYSNIEGSHLVKRGSYYYLFNAVPAQKLVCSRSTSLWGPYGETTTLCTAGKGGHQGGIVDLPDGSYWGYLHQDDGAPGRMTRICPITWQNNWPMFGRSGYIGTVESSYTKPISGKPVVVPAASDEFNGSALGLQWAWNHNPDNSKWSFTGSALRLKATTGSNFWNARNSLTQKGQGQTSTGSIRIDCAAMQNGDIMGLGMLGDPRGYIAVTKDYSGKKIIMSEEDAVKATVSSITATILYFRVEMNFSTKLAKFYWKDDSRSWQQLGTTPTMGFDWQNGTFQGEQYAILCFNTGSSSGYMDVDWFRLDDQPGPGGSVNTPTPTPTRAATPTPSTLNTATPTVRPGTPTPTPTGVVNTPTPTRGTNTPTPTQGASGNYVVTYTISSDWGAGANADVTIKNNTASAVNGWTLNWTFPGTQKITNLWNGTCTQSGAAVSVKDAGYNATISANGGTTSFGFGMNYSGTNAKPTSFTLNGTACQVQ
ncbi:MAG TPA: family 43 glycosylhydrolase [Bacillota bacterium]|nr:family 43 glycosylhydrolase [Bacillota bacterium]